jgi:hypothetical protein
MKIPIILAGISLILFGIPNIFYFPDNLLMLIVGGGLTLYGMTLKKKKG